MDVFRVGERERRELTAETDPVELEPFAGFFVA